MPGRLPWRDSPTITSRPPEPRVASTKAGAPSWVRNGEVPEKLTNSRASGSKPRWNGTLPTPDAPLIATLTENGCLSVAVRYDGFSDTVAGPGGGLSAGVGDGVGVGAGAGGSGSSASG